VTFSGTITSQAIDDPNPPKKKLNTFGLELEQPPSPVVAKFALVDVRCPADGWSAAAMSFLKVIITFSMLKNQALKFKILIKFCCVVHRRNWWDFPLGKHPGCGPTKGVKESEFFTKIMTFLPPKL